MTPTDLLVHSVCSTSFFFTCPEGSVFLILFSGLYPWSRFTLRAFVTVVAHALKLMIAVLESDEMNRRKMDPHSLGMFERVNYFLAL